MTLYVFFAPRNCKQLRLAQLLTFAPAESRAAKTGVCKFEPIGISVPSGTAQNSLVQCRMDGTISTAAAPVDRGVKKEKKEKKARKPREKKEGKEEKEKKPRKKSDKKSKAPSDKASKDKASKAKKSNGKKSSNESSGKADKTRGGRGGAGDDDEADAEFKEIVAKKGPLKVADRYRKMVCPSPCRALASAHASLLLHPHTHPFSCICTRILALASAHASLRTDAAGEHPGAARHVRRFTDTVCRRRTPLHATASSRQRV